MFHLQVNYWNYFIVYSLFFCFAELLHQLTICHVEHLEDPIKMQLMEKVEADLNKIIDESGIDYFEKAVQGRSYLNKLVVMRYLEGIFAAFCR